MTTLQGNKLIANFLGKQRGRKITTAPARMNYHNNWNSLMGVRDEVTALGNVDVIINGNCTVTWDDGTAYYNEVKKGTDTERTATWTALVEFIYWYNNMLAQMAREAKVEETASVEV